MNRARNARLLGIAAIALLAAASALAADTVIAEIVARVNSQIITRADLARSREQLVNEARQQGVPDNDPRYVENEKNVLRDLIDLQLLVQKGQELGITADTEVIKKLDEYRKQLNLSSMEDLEKEAVKQGVSYEDFKLNMRNDIIRQQVIQREVGGRLSITPDEEKKFYDDHKAEMEQPEQVRLSEILISTSPKDKQTAEEALDAAQKKADQALAELKAGKSFNEIAQKYSDGPTAAQGGDLGYFKRGSLAKELEDKTFGMKAGSLTEITRTKQGFVILRVEEHREAGVPPFKNVEPQIMEQLYYQKLQPALRTYLTKLREDAFIDIKQGYVDSGASPNQTQPVVSKTGAAPEGGKSGLKRKKKLGIF